MSNYAKAVGMTFGLRGVVFGLTILAAGWTFSFGQEASDPPFKVKIDFNRWHDYDELKADLLRLVEAFPKMLEYSSVGESYEGRDMILITINNPDTGSDLSKPAMFIEANIHGNEIQGGEVCLYTIWYLMENYGRIENITRLVDERVFYIMPTVNPDGRQFFMEGTGQGARTGQVPVDDDNDGLIDEDDVDDLNGNGVIEQIRKYLPGEGNLRLSALDPRMLELAPPGTPGDYVLLGYEGLDNDKDGEVNEDPPGGYDPNRNYAGDWQPNYVQRGSMDYPFQLPESRAVSDFLMAHTNVAGVQTYHNSGGLILRGPGAESSGEYPRADLRAYDELGKHGERILPFYRYVVLWEDLYTVYGGVVDWTNDGLGIVSFSNELWNGNQYFTSPELQEQQKDPLGPISSNVSRYYFNDYLEFGEEFVEWKEFDHPQYGQVEMGGWKKTSRRVPPRFMNEELCHRNMAFTLFQADQMPQIKMGETELEPLGGQVFKTRIDIKNDKIAPTIMTKAAQNHVVPPDILSVSGNDVEVLSAGWVKDKFRPDATILVDQKDLKRIMVRNGHPGRTTRTIEYILKGSGKVRIQYVSAKGGTDSLEVNLE